MRWHFLIHEFLMILDSFAERGYTRARQFMKQFKQDAKRFSQWEAIGLVWDIVITVIILTFVFAFGGVYLDKIAHTKFLFTAVGFVGLIFIGKKILLKKAKKITDRLNEKTEPPLKP
jgi:F0F1-type ATP synthase assembly protein I